MPLPHLPQNSENEPFPSTGHCCKRPTKHRAGSLPAEKIYLLSAKDGRKRVIMGSANMSAAAFEGRQRENICYMDGDEAFDWYMECYQTLKEKSTDEIGKDSLLCADDGENLEELPIAKTVRVKKAVVIQPVSENQKEEVIKYL